VISFPPPLFEELESWTPVLIEVPGPVPGSPDLWRAGCICIRKVLRIENRLSPTLLAEPVFPKEPPNGRCSSEPTGREDSR